MWPATGSIQTLVWVPVSTHEQGQECRWAERPVAELTPVLWPVESGSCTFIAEQGLVGTSTAKNKKCPEIIRLPLGHKLLPLQLQF